MNEIINNKLKKFNDDEMANIKQHALYANQFLDYKGQNILVLVFDADQSINNNHIYYAKCEILNKTNPFFTNNISQSHVIDKSLMTINTEFENNASQITYFSNMVEIIYKNDASIYAIINKFKHHKTPQGFKIYPMVMYIFKSNGSIYCDGIAIDFLMDDLNKIKNKSAY